MYTCSIHKFGYAHTAGFIKLPRKPQNLRKVSCIQNMLSSLSTTSIRNIFHSSKQFANCAQVARRNIKMFVIFVQFQPKLGLKKSLLQIYSIKFYSNPFGGFRAFTCAETNKRGDFGINARHFHRSAEHTPIGDCTKMTF